MPDEADLDVVVRAKGEGQDVLRDMRELLKDIRQQAIETNVALAAVAGSSAAAAVAMQGLATATGNAAPTTQAAGAAASTAAFSFLGLGVAGWILVGVITAALIVLGPFLLLLVASATILTAFAVGVVAVSTALALAFGPLAALTAGVVLLADRMFAAGKIAFDPLLAFENQLGKIADAWGQKALPMTAQLMAFAQGLLPAVNDAGNAILTWFGEQLPNILMIATDLIKIMSPALQTLWHIFTGFFGQMSDYEPVFMSFFGGLVKVGLQAIAALMENL